MNHDEGEAEVVTPSSPTEAPSGGNIFECLCPESDILMAFHFKILLAVVEDELKHRVTDAQESHSEVRRLCNLIYFLWAWLLI